MPVKKSGFLRLANAAARAAGKPLTFAVAVAIVIAWAICGPVYGFSDTWQLVINTGTTIITFLMVFLIQNTQSRDSEALHVKMDELIRALEGAHNALLDLEELEDGEIDRIRDRYRRLASDARAAIKAGGRDIGCEDVAGDADREATSASPP